MINDNYKSPLALAPKKNQLWVKTEHQISRYDELKKKHEVFTASGRFPPSPVTALLFDRNKLWFGSEGYGLYMFQPCNNITHSLNRIPLTADRYIISLAYDKKENEAWIGTVSGGISIIRFEPTGRDKQVGSY